MCRFQEPAHGTIDLSECLTVKSADEKTEKPHSFEVATPDQVFYMYAANEKEKDDWIGAIGRCVDLVICFPVLEIVNLPIKHCNSSSVRPCVTGEEC